MKLSDQFENTIFRHEVGRNEKEETKRQCAEIAEQFAIEFADWCLNSKTYWTPTKELLEIYKKTL